MALTDDPEFSRLLSIEEMHEGEIKLEATEEERAALSQRFDIEGIEKLLKQFPIPLSEYLL